MTQCTRLINDYITGDQPNERLHHTGYLKNETYGYLTTTLHVGIS